MGMLSLREFEVFRVTRENWFEDLLSVLVAKKLVTSNAARNQRLMSLLYHAHLLGTKLIVIHDGYS